MQSREDGQSHPRPQDYCWTGNVRHWVWERFFEVDLGGRIETWWWRLLATTMGYTLEVEDKLERYNKHTLAASRPLCLTSVGIVYEGSPQRPALGPGEKSAGRRECSGVHVGPFDGGSQDMRWRLDIKIILQDPVARKRLLRGATAFLIAVGTDFRIDQSEATERASRAEEPASR